MESFWELAECRILESVTDEKKNGRKKMHEMKWLKGMLLNKKKKNRIKKCVEGFAESVFGEW